MSEFENKEAIELSLEEMNEVAGGYKPLAPKKGYIDRKSTRLNSSHAT